MKYCGNGICFSIVGWYTFICGCYKVKKILETDDWNLYHNLSDNYSNSMYKNIIDKSKFKDYRSIA